MSTYAEEDAAWFVDRPTVEPPDLSKGDHEDAAQAEATIPTHDIGEPPW